MLNVLFITRKWAPAIGGMETYSMKLTSELDKRVNLDVMKLKGNKNGTPPNLFSLMLFVCKSLVNIILSKRYDVIHIGDLVLWPLCLIAKIFKKESKVVVTAYGLDILYGYRKGFLPKIYHIYLKFGVFLLSNKISVISISSATYEECMKFGFKNVHIVKLGVDIPEKIAIENKSPENYILFVGRVVKRKGAAWFSENVLPHLDESIELFVIGNATDKNEYSILKKNNRVRCFGKVDDVLLAKMRKNASIIVMPNISTGGLDMEGFGLTALEAAVSGNILIASGIEGIKDAVIDQETGFLLPERDVNKWVELINDIYNWPLSKRIKFIENSIDIIRGNYSWSIVAENTISVYNR